MQGRYVKESISEYSELALPNDANGLGNLLGGKIMHLVDLAGAIAAMKHCRNPVVTASVDHMDFIHPVHIGQLVRLRASVNRAFRSSMEVGVKVWVEDLVRLSHVRRHQQRRPWCPGAGCHSGNHGREAPLRKCRRAPRIPVIAATSILIASYAVAGFGACVPMRRKMSACCETMRVSSSGSGAKSQTPRSCVPPSTIPSRRGNM